MTDSHVFKTLPEREAQVLYKIFVDFYYRTNINLWHDQGHQKLSILASGDMQFFGYDLGATLNDEEKALHRVGICSYRVQRIPRESTLRFDQTTAYPHLSVCTPSPHDLPHMTVWWKHNQADIQQFYHQILKLPGTAPLSMTSDIANEIINLHLNSCSMWALFSFEDLFATSEEFNTAIGGRWVEKSNESKWISELNFFLEDLLEKYHDWTLNISKIVQANRRGRNATGCFSHS
jgi:4-alpha-glucanotransferase